MKKLAIALAQFAVISVGGAQAPDPAPSRILFSRAGPGEPGELALFVVNADGSAKQRLAASTLRLQPHLVSRWAVHRVHVRA